MYFRIGKGKRNQLLKRGATELTREEFGLLDRGSFERSLWYCRPTSINEEVLRGKPDVVYRSS